MKLNELLESPQFRKIKLANQQANLSTNVVTIGMMEAPDIINYVVPGQLLVTTGYHFQNNITGLKELITAMKQRGAAAIGIKEHRYFSKIPDDVIELADRLQFPILLLPESVGLSVIVRDLLHVVLEQQTDELTKIMNDSLYISKYILAERSDNEILDHISEMLRCDVFIIDTFGRLQAKNRTATVNDELLDYVATKLELLKLTESQTLLENYIIYPLKTVNKLTSRFVIFNLTGIHSSGQHLLIDNMVNLLSLENMQVGININDERQRRSEFFETLLSRNVSKEVFQSTLTFQDMDINDHCRAFAIDEANSIDTGNHQSSMHRIIDYVYWYFQKIKIPIIVINWDFKISVLVKTEVDLDPILKDLADFIVSNFTEFKIRIGFSNYTKQLFNFKKLMNESNEALDLAKNTHSSVPVKFKPDDVDDILNLIPKNEVRMFIHNALEPILNLGTNERQQLMELLEQYFMENQSLSKAADNLFIHRNTAVYRLKKIEKVLEVNLKEPSVVEKLSLAIKLNAINHHDA
ncbi:PucR family transcriptional regulator ligand-binding domain-containing protein [Nicoliella spurrieriana]|uniref:PucR family transcriptional regulator ligand-binding domain-containing protein n=1 Tax=Nicoliella spurrieriana TaxID=2925830 RepID=A0A976RS73_9LACO|nr:PucR family transcriptional regulator [Nicoliella spurrieriana]UQS86922.1 PucR family transcriptional regulator ligand-binding domain-containing protein [Nicoliella spurrieriana]